MSVKPHTFPSEIDSKTLHSSLVVHSLEIEYIFGRLPATAAQPADFVLGDKMMDYWISFAASLDPNDGKGTQSEYPNSSDSIVFCAFWAFNRILFS